MPINADWNIKARSEICQACEQPFADGQAYISRLTFAEAGYERTDFCESCWATTRNEPPSHSVWKGTFKLPPPEPEPVLRKETAESLFRRLTLDEDGTPHTNSLYILAVMLERRRVLVERDVRVQQSGERVLVYEHRKTGETFLVTDPQLRMDQLEPVQEEVVAMLGGGRAEEDAPEADAT